MPTLRPVCRSGGRPLRRHLGALRRRALQADAGRMEARDEPAPRPARRLLPAGAAVSRRRRVDVQHAAADPALPLRGRRARLPARLSQADQARFARDPRWRPLRDARDADTSLYGESMNTRMAPFDNVEVRRAVAAAIDREHYRLLKPAYVTASRRSRSLPASPATRATPRASATTTPRRSSTCARPGYAYDPATGRGGWPQPIDYVVYDQGLLDLHRAAPAAGAGEDRPAHRAAARELADVPHAAAPAGRRGDVARQLGDGLPGPELVLRAALHDELDRSRVELQHGLLLEPALRRPGRARAPRARRAAARVPSTGRRARSSATMPPGRSPSRTTSSASASPTSAVPSLHPVWSIDATRVWLDRSDRAVEAASGGQGSP